MNKTEYHRQWRSRNKEKQRLYSAARREKDKQDPERRLKKRSSEIFRKYGITQEDYIKQLELQGNKCAICHKLDDGKRYLHIDHCHETGRVRGILCYQCNWYMGLIDKDQDIKVRLAMYGCSINQVHPEIRNKQWIKNE